MENGQIQSIESVQALLMQRLDEQEADRRAERELLRRPVSDIKECAICGGTGFVEEFGTNWENEGYDD